LNWLPFGDEVPAFYLRHWSASSARAWPVCPPGEGGTLWTIGDIRLVRWRQSVSSKAGGQVDNRFHLQTAPRPQ